MSLHPRAIYILHTRDYRESSLIINLFSRDEGRVDAVLNGGKSKKWRGVAREFSPLLAEWVGRGELKTLTQLEQASLPHTISGNALFAGLYVNELLVRLLPVAEPHPDVFDFYCVCLDTLALGGDLEPCLRQFEIVLLDELGYQIHFADQNGSALHSGQFYQYDTQLGFFPAMKDDAASFQGSHLLAIAANEWQDVEVKRAAKRLMRQALKPVLGSEPLKSRQFFRQGHSE